MQQGLVGPNKIRIGSISSNWISYKLWNHFSNLYLGPWVLFWKGGFFKKSIFLDWFQLHLKPKPNLWEIFSKINISTGEIWQKLKFCPLEIVEIQHFRVGILWNVPFSSNLVSTFGREIRMWFKSLKIIWFLTKTHL